MLIITVETQAANVNFLLDGPLAGAGVDELARSWIARAFERPQHRVSLDLRGVTSIDGAGRQFLARAYRHGNTLVGGVTTKAIVDEIRAISEPDSSSATLRVDGAPSATLRFDGAPSATVCVDGALRTPVDRVLRSRVESHLQSGVRRVLLDLSGVSSIDAAGVGELIHLFTTAAAAGGVLEIRRANPRVHRVLEVTGVLGVLDVESSGARSTCS